MWVRERVRERKKRVFSGGLTMGRRCGLDYTRLTYCNVVLTTNIVAAPLISNSGSSSTIHTAPSRERIPTRAVVRQPSSQRERERAEKFYLLRTVFLLWDRLWGWPHVE